MMLFGIYGIYRMPPSLLEQSVEIMLFGMGTVIAFLTLLVIAMSLMKRLLQRFYPSRLVEGRPEVRSATAEGDPVPAELLAVITAAVHRHRSERRQRKENRHG